MVVQHNNDSANNNADDWNDCSSGEVSQMVHRLRSERRTHQIFQTTSAAVIVALVMVSGYFIKQTVLPSESGHVVAGIYCSEVRKLGKDYTAEKLDENKSAQIKHHLADCESCRRFIENMMKGSHPPDAGAVRDTAKSFEKSVASREGSLIPVLLATGS
jgi:hypothetical protein